MNDELQANIWDPQHMDKIVPSLLFNLQHVEEAERYGGARVELGELELGVLPCQVVTPSCQVSSVVPSAVGLGATSCPLPLPWSYHSISSHWGGGLPAGNQVGQAVYLEAAGRGGCQPPFEAPAWKDFPLTPPAAHRTSFLSGFLMLFQALTTNSSGQPQSPRGGGLHAHTHKGNPTPGTHSCPCCITLLPGVEWVAGVGSLYPGILSMSVQPGWQEGERALWWLMLE